MRIQQSESKYLWYAMDKYDKIVRVFHSRYECVKFVSKRVPSSNFKVKDV
jgi:hypothetical protein